MPAPWPPSYVLSLRSPGALPAPPRRALRRGPRLPLARAGLDYRPVICRAGDLFGSTVNIAARIAALALPGQLLATQSVAEAAVARGIFVRNFGMVALRSVAGEVPLYEIELAPSADRVGSNRCARCMHRIHPIDGRPTGTVVLFARCEEAYRRSPQIYDSPPSGDSVGLRRGTPGQNWGPLRDQIRLKLDG